MPEQVTFDHYELLTRSDGSPFELGRGAMGITYKAFDANLRIPVALKVINVPDGRSELARNRFVQEARAAAGLRHRHVASVFHLGLEGDTYFYAMEFIDGETVEALVKRVGPLPQLVSLRICLQVARALHAAYPQGLVHRDLKPSNLMLVQEDDELCTKVIDFGLAKMRLSEEELAAASTTTAGFVGTPHYASPEQLEEREIDSRSDIYSLGATLWYMLTGHPLFSGAVARVVSQHLSSEPAYASLPAGNSPVVIELLRKMLAKDPAARFQQPLELRQALEKAHETIAGGAAAAAARIALEEAKVAAPSLAESDLSTATRVGEHYEVLENLGATNNGWLYHARDTVENREVRLLLFEVDAQTDRSVYTQMEEEVLALQALEHPGLLRVYGMETIKSRIAVVLEWTNGFTLLQLLRSRRRLSAGETMRLLEQMAAGVGYAHTLGVQRLDLSLHQIHVDFAERPADFPQLLHQDLDEWPSFEVKCNPLTFTRELSQFMTWAGGQTILNHGTEVGAAPLAVDSGVVLARGLAVLVYELLGGAVTPLLAAQAGTQGLPRYSPLANLTEQGNEVLRRALGTEKPFPAPVHYYYAMAAVDELENRHHEAKPAPLPPAEARPPASAPQPPRPPFPPRLPERRTPKSVSLLPLATGGVLLVLASGLAYVFLVKEKTPPLAPHRPRATPALSPSAKQIPPELPAATPEPVQMESPPPAEPPPTTPDRRELLKEATAQAEKMEGSGEIAKTVAAWIEVARTYPESEVGRLRLEMFLDALLPRVKQLSATDVAELDPLLKEAVQLEVNSAFMLLGEMQRDESPQDSFRWFSAAAAKGVPAAALQVGLMYSNGTGVERNMVKAVEFLQRAADKGDSSAKAALGECYLLGKGVERDLPRAIELLQASAARSNVRAMNRLGTCYSHGEGVERNVVEARRWYARAAELGSGEALGNLGILDLKGEGLLKPAPEKAVENFRKGAEAGNGYCMFQYAQCFETGTGVRENVNIARSWYKKAAGTGLVRAIEWCKKNGVEY